MAQCEAMFNAYKAINTSNCLSQIKTEFRYMEVAGRDLQGKIRDLLFRA